MSQEFDVLVVGGGVVGLAATLAMAQKNYRVALIDAGNLEPKPDQTSQRVYAINKASQTLLTELGAWQLLEESRVSPYNKMFVWDAINGEHIDFDSRTIAAQNLGHIIEETSLKNALLARIHQVENISLFAQSTASNVHQLKDSICVDAGELKFDVQLLMIADGAASPTREKVHAKLTTWSYEQQAIVATVQTEKPHQKTAYQVFNPDGPLAFLPLTQAHQCSIVWSTQPERAASLMSLDDDSFNEELSKAFAAKLGQVQTLSSRHQFPLQMRHAQDYSGNRWLLLGDAAHTIHPLAGLGLNLGLADVQSWMTIMSKNKGLLCSNKMLGAYQRERKHDVWQTILCMEGFKRLFSHASGPIPTIRGLGLRLCNELTPLKRLFIQHAAG